MARVAVVGSSNTDMVARTGRIPTPGETVMGREFQMLPGGKGANQAVAAARLGAEVTFIACLGTDVFGDRALEGFQKEGMVTRFIFRDEDEPSGVALIFVDEAGENVIVVAPGANDRLTPQHVEQAREAIIAADVLVMQLETPLETVERAAEIAHAANVPVVLNPAPARDLPASLLRRVTCITPNESEAALLAGLKGCHQRSEEDIARELLQRGPEMVVMTRGARGALCVSQDEVLAVPAPKVQAVDTTAAGDAFNGALAVALAEKRPLREALSWAAAAAALSVTRAGAQPSLPTRSQVQEFLS